MKEKKWKKWIYYASLAAFVVVIYKLLDFNDLGRWIDDLVGVLMPFVIGALIAYILYFPCRSIEKLYRKSKMKYIRKKGRNLAILTVYTIAILILLITINFIFPALSRSIIDLASNLPGYYKDVTSYVEAQPEGSILHRVGAQEIIKNLEKIDIKALFSFENLITYIKSALGVVNVIFSIFVSVVVSVYVLTERSRILNFVKKVTNVMFSTKTCDNLGKYFTKTNEIFYRFISSQIIDGVVVGVILSIAMLIMNVKYAVLLGFMIGVFNIIPYFGAIIAVIIALIITVLTGGFAQAIWVGIVIIILQQIDANIINPKIVGNSLTLSPLLVIFAVTLGGAYFNILGMFLAVPIVTVVKIMITDYIEYRSEKKIEQ